MLKTGEMNEMIAERSLAFGIYLKSGQEEVLLPKKYVPNGLRLGNRIRVFVYTDSEDRPIATTLKPKAMVGEFATLQVKDVNSVGTFFDWGLEKDLLVPRSQQQKNMKPGERHVVRVCREEETGRVFGSTRISRFCDKNTSPLQSGQKVEILIYGYTRLGAMALVDDTYQGVLYRSEIFERLSIGTKKTAYVARIREDAKLDLTLKKPGYASVADASCNILDQLHRAGGFLPCHDKTAPEEINRMFGISKKEFKKAIGGLLKNGTISMDSTGIRLKQETSS